MKKGKLLETLRIAVMCCILEKEGCTNASELGRFLGCSRNMVIEYVRAHQDLFEVSNNGISSKKVSLNANGKGKKDPHELILEIIIFAENFCDIPPDDILAKKFIEWFTKNSGPLKKC